MASLPFQLRGNKSKSMTIIVNELGTLLELQVIWCESTQSFYWLHNTVWAMVSDTELSHILSKWVVDNGISRDLALKVVPQQKRYVKHWYWIKELGDPSAYINFTNGIYNIADGTFIPHDKVTAALHLTGQLPFSYNPLSQEEVADPLATLAKDCPVIFDWQVFVSDDDTDVMEFILSYINCAIMSNSSYQLFLELVGSGGTGISTLMKLIESCIGSNNCHITSLGLLENNRFETAQLKNKNLIMVTDSSMYKGSISVLKALTGGDPIRFELKNKNSGASFKFNGFPGVIISSNDFLLISDFSSGPTRRRVIIKFNKLPTDKLNLLSERYGTNTGLFVAELESFVNICTQLPHSFVDPIMSNPFALPAQAAFQQEYAMHTNPIYGFIVEMVMISDCDAVLPFSKLNTETGYKDLNLYSVYSAYCDASKVVKLTQTRFFHLFFDNLRVVHPHTWHLVTSTRGQNGKLIFNLQVRDLNRCIDDNVFFGYSDRSFTSVRQWVIKDPSNSDSGDNNT